MTHRLALLPVLAAVAFPAAPASAAVHGCSLTASETQVITSVRNMGCRAAKRDLNAYRGFIKKSFKTPGGFRCTRVSGGRLGGEWRCVKAKRAYRFAFGD